MGRRMEYFLPAADAVLTAINDVTTVAIAKLVSPLYDVAVRPKHLSWVELAYAELQQAFRYRTRKRFPFA